MLRSSSVVTLSATSTTPIPQHVIPRAVEDSTGADITTATSMFGGMTVVMIILLAISRCRRARHQREQPRPSPPDHSSVEATHPDLPSLVVEYATPGRPDANRGVGRTDPVGRPPSPVDFQLVPNRRPPSSSSLLSEPTTAIVSPYIPQPQTRELMARSIMEVSTIASRSSAAPSDAPSTAELMGTFSSCPPSYATSPSHPPSYVTDTPRGGRTPTSGRLSYASSS